MKTIILLTITSLLWLIACRQTSPNQTEAVPYRLHFPKDSGYILKKEMLPFLLSHALTDTVDSHWDLREENDTIGKYYKVASTEHVMLWALDLSGPSFPTHLILEIDANGALLGSEGFSDHNNGGCSFEKIDALVKYGEYFVLRSCATGSAYSATDLYVFRELRDLSGQQSIPACSSYFYPSRASILDSDIAFYEDSLVMHYIQAKGTMDDNSVFHATQRDTFSVPFIFKNKQLIHDSTKLEELDI